MGFIDSYKHLENLAVKCLTMIGVYLLILTKCFVHKEVLIMLELGMKI